MAKGQFGPREKGEPGVPPICSVSDIERVTKKGMSKEDVMRAVGIKIPKDKEDKKKVKKRFEGRWKLYCTKMWELQLGMREASTTVAKPKLTQKGGISISKAALDTMLPDVKEKLMEQLGLEE